MKKYVKAKVIDKAIEKAEKAIDKRLAEVRRRIPQAIKTSQEMCRLRQEVIDKAVLWTNETRAVEIVNKTTDLMKVVREYVKFQKKHYPKDYPTMEKKIAKPGCDYVTFKGVPMVITEKKPKFPQKFYLLHFYEDGYSSCPSDVTVCEDVVRPSTIFKDGFNFFKSKKAAQAARSRIVKILEGKV